MKYILTKDGKIVDLEKFINEEKDTPYYKDFIFDEITQDGHLNWTAIGTDKNTIEGQKGRRCQFGATLNSEIVKQADTIPELCDEYVLKRNKLIESEKLNEIHIGADTLEELKPAITICAINNVACEIYGAIWTEWGLKYVAKMNEKGELKLI